MLVKWANYVRKKIPEEYFLNFKSTFLSPLKDENIPNHLKSMQNLRFVKMDFVGLNRGLPTEQFSKEDHFSNSTFGPMDVQDLTRLALLYKVILLNCM